MRCLKDAIRMHFEFHDSYLPLARATGISVASIVRYQNGHAISSSNYPLLSNALVGWTRKQSKPQSLKDYFRVNGRQRHMARELGCSAVTLRRASRGEPVGHWLVVLLGRRFPGVIDPSTITVSGFHCRKGTQFDPELRVLPNEVQSRVAQEMAGSDYVPRPWHDPQDQGEEEEADEAASLETTA